MLVEAAMEKEVLHLCRRIGIWRLGGENPTEQNPRLVVADKVLQRRRRVTK